jgi:hypothetical protein
MTLRRLIILPLAMLIIAGLAFAPLATPASAKAFGMGMMGDMHAMSHTHAMPDMSGTSDTAMHHTASMHHMMHDTHMHSMAVDSVAGMPMAADMPCCPSDKKSDNCPDCPVMAICALKTAQAHPSMDGALLLRSPVRTTQSALDDAPLAGLDHPPPDHPPRYLI